MTENFERNLLAAPAVPSRDVDIYSGVARLAQTVWASEVYRRGAQPTTAVVLVHPTANFLGHYALTAIAERGFGAIGMTTRYVGNDSNLRMENCLLDIGAVVAHLRAIGYERVVLIGNSGGGSIAPYYQAQAANPTITAPPGGGPDLTATDLPEVDAVGLLMAHIGRARLVGEWLDAAIVDEADPAKREASLDIFDPANGPPFTGDFVARVRAGQLARNRRITAWAQDTLTRIADWGPGVSDVPFVVHGTCADPRLLDGAVDPSDRPVGESLWGDPRAANFAPFGIARYTTARSWLNQWSVDHSLGEAPRWLPELRVPVHIVYGTADTSVPPSHAREMFAVTAPEFRSMTEISGAGHYFIGQPNLLAEACDALAAWIRQL